MKIVLGKGKYTRGHDKVFDFIDRLWKCNFARVKFVVERGEGQKNDEIVLRGRGYIWVMPFNNWLDDGQMSNLAFP